MLFEFNKAWSGGSCFARAGYLLQRSPDTLRTPHASAILNGNLNRLKNLRSIPDFAPDLAVEVLCSRDTFEDTERRAMEYLDSGTSFVWIVNPYQQSVHVYSEGGREVQRLGSGDTLSGGTFLLGFSVGVSELFPEPLPGRH